MFGDIEKHLKSEEHILRQCKKNGQRLRTFASACNVLNQKRLKTLMKACLEPQFGYYCLIWMFCERNLNSRTNHLRERSLRIVYNDYESLFQKLLD